MKCNEEILKILNQRLADELAAIKLSHEVADEGSVDLSTRILKTEEAHFHWAEIQPAQTEQMGLENYLTNQVKGTVI